MHSTCGCTVAETRPRDDSQLTHTITHTYSTRHGWHDVTNAWGNPTCKYGFMNLGCVLRAGDHQSAKGGIRVFKNSFVQTDTERRFLNFAECVYQTNFRSTYFFWTAYTG
jgi:hypothetical protein